MFLQWCLLIFFCEELLPENLIISLFKVILCDSENNRYKNFIHFFFKFFVESNSYITPSFAQNYFYFIILLYNKSVLNLFFFLQCRICYQTLSIMLEILSLLMGTLNSELTNILNYFLILPIQDI